MNINTDNIIMSFDDLINTLKENNIEIYQHISNDTYQLLCKAHNHGNFFEITPDSSFQDIYNECMFGSCDFVVFLTEEEFKNW